MSRRAVIDVGSNSVLALIAESDGATWHPLSDTSEVTALGDGVKKTGLLKPDRMVETLRAIKAAQDSAKLAGAECRAFGTMALRISSNADEFLRMAAAQATPVQVLSGEQEATLSLDAVRGDTTFADSYRITMVDIGGHSTEIATSEKDSGEWRTVFQCSRPVGTLRLLDEVMSEDVADGLDQLRASAVVDEIIGFRYLPDKCGLVVVVGATGTNLVSIRDQLSEWSPERVHGAQLDYEQISGAVKHLCGLTSIERAAIVGIENGRERTIHAGALILERALYAVGAEGCRVSVRGWRYAMLDHF
ncbi:MAG: hypothetical protein U0R49_08040 [Fimbriimonadales bacterium]